MTSGRQFQGMAYGLGQASGPLTSDCAQAAGAVLRLHGDALAALPPVVAERPPAGLLLVDAAPFSHPAIAVLGLGCPTVIITADQAAQLHDGMTVMLDGSTGLVCIGPQPAEVEVPAPPPPPVAGSPVLTHDGASIALRASIRNPVGARRAIACGATGIGLVRSEFLLPADGRIPDTLFYLQALRHLCTAAAPLPVRVRLLDLAPDKLPPWLPATAAMRSPLGLQGARLFETEPVASVVKAQLAAIAALASEHPLGVIIPFLTHPSELRAQVAELRRRLGEAVPVGAMAETPAAVLDIGQWLNQADFVAIGCNDLMQALFAADRDQPALREYLDPYAPVLYRLLGQAAAAAGERIHRVQLCGLLPQLKGVLPVLLGLGYRAFSVDARQIPYLAAAVRASSVTAATGLAATVCAATDACQVRDLLTPVVKP